MCRSLGGLVVGAGVLNWASHKPTEAWATGGISLVTHLEVRKSPEKHTFLLGYWATALTSSNSGWSRKSRHHQ